jgi:hypothetical protein
MTIFHAFQSENVFHKMCRLRCRILICIKIRIEIFKIIKIYGILLFLIHTKVQFVIFVANFFKTAFRACQHNFPIVCVCCDLKVTHTMCMYALTHPFYGNKQQRYTRVSAGRYILLFNMNLLQHTRTYTHRSVVKQQTINFWCSLLLFCQRVCIWSH